MKRTASSSIPDPSSKRRRTDANLIPPVEAGTTSTRPSPTYTAPPLPVASHELSAIAIAEVSAGETTPSANSEGVQNTNWQFLTVSAAAAAEGRDHDRGKASGRGSRGKKIPPPWQHYVRDFRLKSRAVAAPLPPAVAAPPDLPPNTGPETSDNSVNLGSQLHR